MAPTRSLLRLALVLAAVTACTDSPAAPRTPADRLARADGAASTDAPALRDGRLVFRDVEQVRAYLKPIADASPADLARREASVPGFTSLRAYLDDDMWWLDPANVDWESDALTGSAAKAQEADGVVRSDFLFGDATLSVLDSRGEVQIGDRVFKLTRDNSYEVSEDDVGLLADHVPRLDSPAPIKVDDRITVRPVVTRVSFEDEATRSSSASFDRTPLAPGPRAGAVGMPIVGCIRYLDAGLRMVGASFISFGYPFTEAGVLTEWHRRKGSGRKATWVLAGQAGTFTHNWSARLWTTTANGPVLVYDGQGQRSSPFGSAQLITILHRELNLAYFGVFGTINATHRMTNPEFNPTCGSILVFY